MKPLRYHVILISSLGIGALSAIPRLMRLNYYSFFDFFQDVLLHFCFSMLIWGFNTVLPKWFPPSIFTRYPYLIRIITSCLLGSLIMLLVYQFESLFIQPVLIYNRLVGLQLRSFIVSLLIIAIIYTLELFEKSQQLLLENEQLKNESLRAQFALLKQQINPHFLFNSLNTLKSMVKEHDDRSEDFIIKLSEVYRYLLQNNTKDKVLVSEEIHVMDAYVFMLQSRFGENLKLDIFLSPQALQSYMPPFTLQLLIENAVKHNVVSQVKPLTITIHDQAEQILVSNTLQLKKSVEHSTQVGLKNINSRYMFLIGRPVTISETYQKFTISLPIIYAHESIDYRR